MLERLNPVLRVVCLLLGAFLVYQAVASLKRQDPLKDLNLGMGLPVAGPTEAKGGQGTNSAPRAPMAGRAAELPAPIQARVDTIIQSEILGTVPRPQPMMLMGIAGDHAFLRTPSGQSGLMREGQELGGIKLVKIGSNRVLVEENGEKKELTIFSGFGGETLLPKGEKH